MKNSPSAPLKKYLKKKKTVLSINYRENHCEVPSKEDNIRKVPGYNPQSAHSQPDECVFTTSRDLSDIIFLVWDLRVIFPIFFPKICVSVRSLP